MGVERGLIYEGSNTLRVSENRMLRRISGPKREEETGEWSNLHSDDNLCSSPNIVKAVKSRRKKLAELVASMRQV
jgi:hypothetical protein